ncbi:hypothetical protein [Devosia chinhatensis]|uniref:Coenzyme F390 synthetase n=1 Tax=Devosia chinhatensis TaxID=429727 RepID=A0A0F5FJB0_9HYPH|nr:hypothetical protein [Devosia chinhatensis]KKB08888.1 hypothetical protein VE26_02225 [Devosia chinhatensis]
MSFVGYVKSNLTRLPMPVGQAVSLVPFAFRPGIATIYRLRKKQIAELSAQGVAQRKKAIFERVKAIASYAYANVPFYSELYRAGGVDPARFSTFDDLADLPIINKAMLQSVPLEHRSSSKPGRYIVNTGGSSGSTLEFYIEPSSVAHEWAHMHTIWARLGFRQTDLRIVFAGRSDVRNLVMYDSARHQFNVDIYAGWQAVADNLVPIFQRFRAPYLHGYPSSIFDFVQWLEDNNHPLLGLMRGKVRGMLLGSEFPAPQARSATERLLGCSSISWYGHTERALLAYETAKGIYEPFQSYGFAEAVQIDTHSKLICTGFYNQASPFIRYDTGDLVEGRHDEGLLRSFEIREGRSGEFIIDAHGNKVFLTALIFGRHHKCFDYCSHIQLKQEHPGQVTVFGVARPDAPADRFAQDFDAANVALTFKFCLIAQPFRTSSGKVPLLVR